MTITMNDVLNADRTEILISPDKWDQMRGTYSKDDIKAAISAAIDEYDIPMPLRHITEQDAIDAFNALVAVDCSELIKTGSVYSRYEYDHDMGDQYLSQCRTGNAASDYFHQYNRFLCDSINAPSPYRSWTIPKFRNGMLEALFSLKFKEVTMAKLRSAIALRKYLASQYKPVIAKTIYELYGGRDILDFSAGWGDRLAGFYAAGGTRSYIGIDPNKRLRDGYNSQIDMYSSIIKGKHARIIEGCAEDILPALNTKFDLVFTSPPYYNIERYTQEGNQSWKKYRKFDLWMNEFLLPVLEMSWKLLKPNGTMIINVADVYSNHTINKICDPMIDFVSMLPMAKFDGSISMQMSKRPNSNSTRMVGTFVEPMWVFKKLKWT